MARVVIDPVTRIGGHLRIEVAMEGGTVSDAWSSGTTFRGFEGIIRNRDPRDAYLFAQRICGICNGVHAQASVRAVEDALRIAIPSNARFLRNLLMGAEFVQDHVLSFYTLQALDWVDYQAALTADPSATAALAKKTGHWSLSSPEHFKAVQDRLRVSAASGQLGIFANGWWGHPAYTLPPEADLLLMSHYLDAMDWQRRFAKLLTMLGGKSPHLQSYLVGGMGTAPPWGGPNVALPGEHPQQVERDTPPALSEKGIADMTALIDEARVFVEEVLGPDALLLAQHYGDWAAIGAGHGNFMSYGEFPLDDSTQPKLLFPRGRIMDRDLVNVGTVEADNIAETVAHAYYTYPDGDAAYLQPGDGITDPGYTGPTPPVTTLEGATKYSWLKAPRYVQEPMEVGALARILIAHATGPEEVQAMVADAISAIGAGPEGLYGTIGRINARAIEARIVVKRLQGWLDRVVGNMSKGDIDFVDIAMWDPEAWPGTAAGFSMGEGTRGSVGHWVSIGDRRVSAYQVVDATTWNASPRDAMDRRGPMEEALVGTPVFDTRRPLEVLRVVHSFDPCAACAVHAYDPDGAPAIDVRISGRGTR